MKKRLSDADRQSRLWLTVGLCFLMVCTCLGFCSSGRTLYLTPITAALSIPRGLFSLNDTFRYVTTSVVNLFFGALVTRFGTKKLICGGFVCLIAFALINSAATSLVGFYIAGILLGIGLTFTGTTMVSVVINKCCTKNKSTLTGAVLAANGIGSAIAVQILSPIIFREGDPFGYRASYRLVALILAAVLVLVLVFYRNPQAEAGDGATAAKGKKKIRGTGWVGMEYGEVIRKPYFYVALVCMFLTGTVLQGLNGIAAPHLYDIGFDTAYVAALVSLAGVLLTASKFLTGFLYDRLGMKIAMNIALVSAFFAITMLSFIENNRLGEILAMVRVFFNAFALPLETVMLPIFAVEFFGNKAFDRLIGIFVSVSTAGFAIGSPLGNLFYDVCGDYKLAFIVFGVLMLAVAVMLQFVLRAANRDKKAILEAIDAASGTLA